jgi:hypothetical protein
MKMNEKLESIIKQHMEAAGLEYHPPAAPRIDPGQPAFEHLPMISISPDLEQAVKEIAEFFGKVKP